MICLEYSESLRSARRHSLWACVKEKDCWEVCVLSETLSEGERGIDCTKKTLYNYSLVGIHTNMKIH